MAFSSFFSAFSKRFMAPQLWVFAHFASLFKPSSELMLGLKYGSFCVLVVSLRPRTLD
jgi:hypothetical protein